MLIRNLHHAAENGTLDVEFALRIMKRRDLDTVLDFLIVELRRRKAAGEGKAGRCGSDPL